MNNGLENFPQTVKVEVPFDEIEKFYQAIEVETALSQILRYAEGMYPREVQTVQKYVKWLESQYDEYHQFKERFEDDRK